MDENSLHKTQFSRLPFDVIAPQDQPLQLGLVTLETDLTIENEFRHFLGDGALSLIHTRIACDDQVTADNLTMMEDRFAESLSLFPPQYAFDAVGYGCTSASLLIGEANVEKIVKSHIDTKHVTTPMTAAKRGLSKLGARNIGFLADLRESGSHLAETKFRSTKRSRPPKNSFSFYRLNLPRMASKPS